MPARFSACEILDITGGRLACGMLPEGSGVICTDTRLLSQGDWYLALAGERFDGHDFLGDAFSNGAIGCIVKQRISYAIASTQFPLIAVLDTQEAYQALSTSWRKQVNPLVVAITGSSGKTTTKEMCAAALSAGLRVHKSQSNENNEFGVPKTILSMPENTQVLVLEMAMRGLGQIAQLAKTAAPDIGIIVNAGVAHLELLSTLDNIVKAKCELLGQLNEDIGVAIIGQPAEPLIDRARKVFKGKIIAFEAGCLKELEVTPESTVFGVRKLAGEPMEPIFQIKAHGLSHLQDAWCAIVSGWQAGLDDATIAQGLKTYEPVTGRGNRLTMANGAVIVDESYNANPDSVRSSVMAFLDRRVYQQSKKYLVLGELAELGDRSQELHELLGRWVAAKQLAGLITVGRMARNIAVGAKDATFEVIACQSRDEAEVALRARLSSEDTSALVKGSHSAQLDQLVLRLVSNAVPEIA